MNPIQSAQQFNRRTFLNQSLGLGSLALASMSNSALGATAIGSRHPLPSDAWQPGLGRPEFPNHRPTAKRVIYLFQSGAPSQFETFDYKPKLVELAKTELPDSIRMGQRLTGMTSGQASFPVAPSIFKFAQYGQSGMWFSELLPHLSSVADDLCVVRSMYTEAINHDPAITFFQTGSQLAGRPSIGAWVAYGLGTMNRDLPTFIVMLCAAPVAPPDSRCTIVCGAVDRCRRAIKESSCVAARNPFCI